VAALAAACNRLQVGAAELCSALAAPGLPCPPGHEQGEGAGSPALALGLLCLDSQLQLLEPQPEGRAPGKLSAPGCAILIQLLKMPLVSDCGGLGLCTAQAKLQHGNVRLLLLWARARTACRSRPTPPPPPPTAADPAPPPAALLPAVRGRPAGSARLCSRASGQGPGRQQGARVPAGR
jgi:hypothetical protein